MPSAKTLIWPTCIHQLSQVAGCFLGGWESCERDNRTFSLTWWAVNHYQRCHGIRLRKPLKKSLLNSTETLSVGPSKKLIRLKTFQRQFNLCSRDNGLGHPAGFFMEVFACVTSQPYLILAVCNSCYFTISK